MNNKLFKSLFAGILTLGLVFSTFVVAFAAGGSGGGNGNVNTDPISLVGAYLTTISGNVSSTGKEINGSNTVEPNPTIKLAFDRNVVNATVWGNNSKTVSLADSDGNAIAINVSCIPDEGSNANRDEKQHIFVSPVASLTPGKTYTITVKSNLTGKDGNTLKQKETITFTVKTDNTPPELTISAPNDLILTNKNKMMVSGSTEIGSVVKINGTIITVDEKGLFSQEITLSFGLNKIQISSTDAADNTTIKELQITYDNVAPELKITTPTDNFVSKTDKITISGTSEKDATVKVNGTVVTLDANNAFNEVVSLVKGANTITITSTDVVGNTTASELHVTYDNTAPAGDITPPVNNGNNVGTTTTTNTTNELPDTASNMYNLMYAGILLFIIGFVMIATPRLRRYSR
jgi:hypothetical protein